MDQLTLVSNSLFYTLSTIAQTLAAVFAVLVAFVLFRLARLDEAIDYALLMLRGQEPTLPSEEAARVLWAGGCDFLVERFPTLQVTFGQAGPNRQRLIDARVARRRRIALVWTFYLAAILTAADLGVCIYGLSSAAALVIEGSAPRVTLLGVVLFCNCIGLYGGIVVLLVQKPESSLRRSRP